MVANLAKAAVADPLGNVTLSGAGYETEYQYLGMENDGFAYYGGNRYYSPVMGRFLSLNGPLSSAGGFGSGVGPVAAAMGAMSSNGGGGVPISPFTDVPGAAAPAFWGAEGFLAGAEIGAQLGGDSAGPPGAVIGGILGAIGGLFQDLLSGGSGGPPGWIIWKETHTGNLAVQVRKSGINPALAASWAPSAPTGRIQLVGDNTPPLQEPEYRRPEPPELRAAPTPPHLHLTFGQCEALALTLTANYTASCAVNAVLCGSSAFGNPEGPASCVGALGPCSIVAGETTLCYAQSRGVTLPAAPHAP